MDNIDKKILHLLQENARYPLKHLASKVFLSSPAVSARIERLEKSGIISGYHASVAPVSLGYHITAFINMALDPKRKPEFYPFIQACPNVLECNCVTQMMEALPGQLSGSAGLCAHYPLSRPGAHSGYRRHPV